MKKDIIQSIENLKNYTNDSISQTQNAKIPCFINLDTEQRFSYNEHGYYHSIYKGDCLLYLISNLPFNINSKKHTFNDKLDKLVKDGDIFPFLLFFNNRFIKWSEITIIKDCKYSYIMVDNYNEKDPDIKCILLPLNSKYTENELNIVDSLFAFNKFGECVDELDKNGPYTCISLKSMKNVYFEADRINTFRQKMKLEPPKKIYKDNLFVFNEGLLDTNITLQGLNTFSIDDRKPLELANRMIYKAFSYEKANDSKDNINYVTNKTFLTEKIQNGKVLPKYLNELKRPFNFKFKPHEKYNKNIAESLNYIMKYNSALMNSVYKSRSNVVSRTYKGLYIKKLADINGYVTMSRRIEDSSENGVIIFVNGLLYKGYNSLQYRHKDFVFPVRFIEDDDDVEIVFFKNINNRVIDFTCYSALDDNYIMDSSFDMENAKLFTIDIREKEFNTERKESAQYEIEFDYERVNNNKVKIIPKDNFYYDRQLSMVSSRQFRYVCKIAKEPLIDIQLPKDFRFCNNLNQYMVFINGRRIDNNNFRVTIVKPTRPFDNISVYVNIPVEKGEKIEVLYVADEIQEIVNQDKLDMSGKIVVDKTKLGYNMSKELYLVFINGKKIRLDQMQDISDTSLLISSDIQTTRNVCILKHIKDDDVLTQLFKENEGLLNEVIKTIPPKDLYELFNSKSLINNKETNFKENEIPMEYVMNQLIRDYWMRPYINTGEDMLFDFDNEFKNDSYEDIISKSYETEFKE